ncbi:MAG TPA: hypothetical protein VGQ62_10760 [Chloroflexota bacterium]|nr:hypothetical protein [Chloroflexota bacterium]
MDVAGLALDPFERQAEAFLKARSWREWQFLSGQRPGRGLVSLYERDFPNFTSTDLWADLQAATPEEPRQLRELSELLASANIEGRTRTYAVNATRVEASAQVVLGDTEIAWREAAARWPLLIDAPRRHDLEQAWRDVIKSELNPTLEPWQEAMRAQLPALGPEDWLAFWSRLRGIEPAQPSQLAELVLQSTEALFGHGLSVYLAQVGLPIDDVWQSDIDWAFRASRFDVIFPEHLRMPLLIRVHRDLGIELTEQSNLHLEYGPLPGVRTIPLDVPGETHVVQRLTGGWQDYANSLTGLGWAQHLVQTDPSLRFWERWLGDETPHLASGRLFEALLHDRTWLAARLDYVASDDFVVISQLARLYRIRQTAAEAAYEQRLWQAEPGASLAATYEEVLTGATRTRHFSDEYLRILLGSPWSTLRPAVELRADVFAAQVRAFLRREFDEEWWHSGRAARFIKDELWRPGKRHSAEELLGFMGYEGLDPAILAAEFEEVLRSL